MSVLRSAAFAATGLALSLQATAHAGGGVNISSYGQRALLIQGSGRSVLVNPYKAVGCAAGLPEPRINAGVILASSELADEGARGIASGRFLVAPGSYKVNGLNLEGFASPHDRIEGRRFGNATLWRWQQGGLEFAHIGATAGPISGADRVLLGRPDVLIIGVGGGDKIYDGPEAAAVVKQLNRTEPKLPKTADIVGDSIRNEAPGAARSNSSEKIELERRRYARQKTLDI